jgi:hypothetical protein
MERGSDSINNLMSYVIFNIAPTLADIGIAVAYFTAAFGVYYGMIVYVHTLPLLSTALYSHSFAHTLIQPFSIAPLKDLGLPQDYWLSVCLAHQVHNHGHVYLDHGGCDGMANQISTGDEHSR